MRCLLVIASGALWLFVGSGNSQGATSSVSGVLPASPALLQQRADELSTERRSAVLYVSALEEFRSQLKAAETCTDSASAVDAAALSAELSSAVTAIESAEATTVVDEGRKEFDALDKVVERIGASYGQAAKCVRGLEVRSRLPIFSRTETNLPESVRAFVSKAMPAMEADNDGSLDKAASFLFTLRGESTVRSAIDQDELKQLASIKISPDQISTVVAQRKQKYKEIVGKLTVAVEGETSTAQTKISAIDEILGKIDEKLAKGTAATDRQLINAVYMMIISLIVLFLGIRFLSEPIATKIVENRSLVEVVSMAFLLLTIIILGTGSKMPQEAIGTLLGSIAGYIFGRKQSERG